MVLAILKGGDSMSVCELAILALPYPCDLDEELSAKENRSLDGLQKLMEYVIVCFVVLLVCIFLLLVN